MKIITTTETGRVAYAFEESERIVITESNITIGDPATQIIGDLNSENAEVITGVTLPEDFRGGKYIYKDGQFSISPDWIDPDKPAVVVPQSVTMKQARLALIQEGYLVKVESAFNAIPDEKEKATALTWWEYSLTVTRDNKYVLLMLAALQLTSEQGDGLFILADSIKDAA